MVCLWQYYSGFTEIQVGIRSGFNQPVLPLMAVHDGHISIFLCGQPTSFMGTYYVVGSIRDFSGILAELEVFNDRFSMLQDSKTPRLQEGYLL